MECIQIRKVAAVAIERPLHEARLVVALVERALIVAIVVGAYRRKLLQVAMAALRQFDTRCGRSRLEARVQGTV